MKIIHKFRAFPEEEGTSLFSVRLPEKAKFLHVQQQGPMAQMWWLLDPEAKKFKRTFRVVATGEDFDDEGLDYLATFFMDEGAYVFHLFEVDETCTRCGKPRDGVTYDGGGGRELCKDCGKEEGVKQVKL